MNKEQENNQQTITKNYLKVVKLLFSFKKTKNFLTRFYWIFHLKKGMIFWTHYLNSIRMFESFEFYQEHSYDIPALLSINIFIKSHNH